MYEYILITLSYGFSWLYKLKTMIWVCNELFKNSKILCIPIQIRSQSWSSLRPSYVVPIQGAVVFITQLLV